MGQGLAFRLWVDRGFFTLQLRDVGQGLKTILLKYPLV